MKPSCCPGGLPAYAACTRKTFQSVLCHLLQTEFPATFGPTVTRLFADKIEELYERCHPPLARVKVGQVLWLAVAASDRAHNQRIENTRLVPVLLDLVTPKDIDATFHGGQRLATRRDKVVRLFQQAFAQGGVLSEADVALLLHVHDHAISEEVRAYERASGDSVPRRGTIHDLGRSVSHKAVICYKRLVEKKSTSQVAQETYHSPEEVEYYVQCCRRIQLCCDNGMSPEDTALATGHSLFLVHEYLRLLQQFNLPPVPFPNRKEAAPPPNSRPLA
jgi:Protein of unknown function (DUF1670)